MSEGVLYTIVTTALPHALPHGGRAGYMVSSNTITASLSHNTPAVLEAYGLKLG